MGSRRHTRKYWKGWTSTRGPDGLRSETAAESASTIHSVRRAPDGSTRGAEGWSRGAGRGAGVRVRSSCQASNRSASAYAPVSAKPTW